MVFAHALSRDILNEDGTHVKNVGTPTNVFEEKVNANEESG